MGKCILRATSPDCHGFTKDEGVCVSLAYEVHIKFLKIYFLVLELCCRRILKNQLSFTQFDLAGREYKVRGK